MVIIENNMKYFEGYPDQYVLLDELIKQLSAHIDTAEEDVMLHVYRILVKRMSAVRLSLRQMQSKDDAWKETFVITCAEDFARMFVEDRKDAVIAEVLMVYTRWKKKYRSA